MNAVEDLERILSAVDPYVAQPQQPQQSHKSTDLPHWLGIVFRSRPQKVAFLRAAGMSTTADLHQDAARFRSFLRGARLPPPQRRVAEGEQVPVEREEQGFARRAREEAERFRLYTDSAFWVALCHRDQVQLEETRALLARLPVRSEGRWYDGVQLAAVTGVELPTTGVLRVPRPNRRWARYVVT